MTVSIAAYRQAGDQAEDVDVADNANIQTSKLGTRTLYREIPVPGFVLNGSSVALTTSGVFSGITMPDANTGNIYAAIPLPDEWDEVSDIVVSIYWNTTATAGNAKFTGSVKSTTDDGTLTSENSQTATTAAQGVASRLQVSTLTFAAALFTKSDVIGLLISRDPSDAADTLGANLAILAVNIEFTGQG